VDSAGREREGQHKRKERDAQGAQAQDWMRRWAWRKVAVPHERFSLSALSIVASSLWYFDRHFGTEHCDMMTRSGVEEFPLVAALLNGS